MYLSDIPKLPRGPAEPIIANDGAIVWERGQWWFVLVPEARRRIEKRLGRKIPEAVPAEPLAWCNPTPPILPTLGGFLHPGTGWYCEPPLPRAWREAWKVWTEVSGLSDAGPFRGPAPIDKDRGPWRRFTPKPPFWVEFAGPKTDGCCWHGGPFETVAEASRFAAKHAGFKRAPSDGWFQVFDSKGRIVVIT